MYHLVRTRCTTRGQAIWHTGITLADIIIVTSRRTPRAHEPDPGCSRLPNKCHSYNIRTLIKSLYISIYIHTYPAPAHPLLNAHCNPLQHEVVYSVDISCDVILEIHSRSLNASVLANAQQLKQLDWSLTWPIILEQ